MSEGGNAAIARRLLDEVWVRGNLEVVDELVDPDFVNFGQRRGTEAYKWIVGLWRTAFSDVEYKVDDEIVAGDAVVQRVTCSGTHLGEFRHMMGTIPPTGKRFSVDQIHIQRFARHGGYSVSTTSDAPR